MRQSKGKTLLCENVGLTHSPSSLADNFSDQATRFRKPFKLITDAITGHAFPGASLSVALRGELLALAGFGQFTYDADSPRVEADTIFDLASLTKPLATTTMAMLLYERGFLELDAPASAVLPELRTDVSDSRRQEITFRMLLAHSSGLPAYARLFQAAKGTDIFLRACTLPLEAAPGTRTVYSDIGFIVLGRALEWIAAEELDSFCRREVFGRLGLTRTMFRPPRELRMTVPPTEDDQRFRHSILQGEVNDENAGAMGGVAGHAGLFGSARNLTIFADCVLKGGSPMLKPETIALFTARQTSPSGTSWALGWDTPTAPSQSGKYLSKDAYGHLGFTGTSLWIDPQRQLSIAFLTNRTWPDRRSEAIKQVRPQLHDAIVESLNLT